MELTTVDYAGSEADRKREAAALVGDGTLRAAIGAAVRNLFRPPAACVSHALKLVYFPVPKAGSTTIQELMEMAEHDARYVDPRLGTPSVLEWIRPTARDLAGYDHDGYISFTVVRNPWARLVSTYRDKIVGLVDGHAPRRGEVYAGLHRYNRLALGVRVFHPAMGFGRFAQVVARIPDAVADPHFGSQHRRFLARGGELLPDVVLHLEAPREIVRLFRIRGLEIDELPKRRSARPYNWRQFYADPEITEVVGRRYAADVAHLGYQPPVLGEAG